MIQKGIFFSSKPCMTSETFDPMPFDFRPAPEGRTYLADFSEPSGNTQMIYRNSPPSPILYSKEGTEMEAFIFKKKWLFIGDMSFKWAEGGGEGQSLGEMSPKKSSFFLRSS